MHNIRLATVLEVVAWDQPSSELCTVRALHVTELLIFEPSCALSLWGVPFYWLLPLAVSSGSSCIGNNPLLQAHLALEETSA
jgi:hypothetical protein